MRARAVFQRLPRALSRAGIPPRVGVSSSSAAVGKRGTSYSTDYPSDSDHSIEYYARIALRKRECSVGDWLTIRDLLCSAASQCRGGPSTDLSPAAITDLFRLTNRRLYKGVLGNRALPAQTILAAVEAYLQQPSGQHFSRDEISSCFLKYVYLLLIRNFIL